MELNGMRKGYVAIKNTKQIKINIRNRAEPQYEINNGNSTMKANLIIMQRLKLKSLNMKKSVYRGHNEERNFKMWISHEE